MTAAVLGLVLVPLGDHAIKRMLRRQLQTAAISLGPIGTLRLVESRMWMTEAGRLRSLQAMCAIWLGCAAAVMAATAIGAVPGWSAGALTGGALSHLIETSRRGMVVDYVCLRFWPPFDFADVAITVGAGGALVAVCARVFG